MPQQLLAWAAIAPVLLSWPAPLRGGPPIRAVSSAYTATHIDTLLPGQQLRIANVTTPAVLLLRNVSAAGAYLPVMYSLFAGCDSINGGVMPEGSSSPLIFNVTSKEPIAVTQLGVAADSRLEVRYLPATDSAAMPLRPNVAPLVLQAYAIATSRIHTAHAQLGLNALFESTRFIVIAGTSVRVCSVNMPGPATKYSTPNNTLLFPLDGIQNQLLTVINASSSSTATSTVVLRDMCVKEGR